MANSLAVQDEKTLRYLLKSLTPEEQLYVDSRVAGAAPEVAMRIAGIPWHGRMTLDARPEIVSAIQYTIKTQIREIAYTREDIAAGFMDAINVASTAGEMISGWREIAKLYGLYAPEKRETLIRKEAVQSLTDEELARAAGILEGDYEVLDFEEDSGHG